MWTTFQLVFCKSSGSCRKTQHNLLFDGWDFNLFEPEWKQREIKYGWYFFISDFLSWAKNNVSLLKIIRNKISCFELSSLNIVGCSTKLMHIWLLPVWSNSGKWIWPGTFQHTLMVFILIFGLLFFQTTVRYSFASF